MCTHKDYVYSHIAIHFIGINSVLVDIKSAQDRCFPLTSPKLSKGTKNLSLWLFLEHGFQFSRLSLLMRF